MNVTFVTNKNRNTIISAVKRLSEILESEVNSYGASTRLVPISLTLVIPKNIGGLIVGQGGKNIKDLRVNSGAQIIFSAEEQFKNLFRIEICDIILLLDIGYNILNYKKCLPNSDERTCKITGNNFSVVTAIELVVEKIIEAAIQESKGEFKGTPSSQIVPYDPSKDTGEVKNEKVRIST